MQLQYQLRLPQQRAIPPDPLRCLTRAHHLPCCCITVLYAVLDASASHARSVTLSSALPVPPAPQGALVLYTKFIKPQLAKHASKLDPVFASTETVSTAAWCCAWAGAGAGAGAGSCDQRGCAGRCAAPGVPAAW